MRPLCRVHRLSYIYPLINPQPQDWAEAEATPTPDDLEESLFPEYSVDQDREAPHRTATGQSELALDFWSSLDCWSQ